MSSSSAEFYSFTVPDAQGNDISMSDYKGKVVMIVNVASSCGLTPQYQELQQLYEQYKDEGFEILAFPCNQFAFQERGSNEEICQFARTKFNVTFKIFAKTTVNGSDTIPLYKYLKKEGEGSMFNAIKWNFTKFLITRDGKVLQRYSPYTKPLEIEEDIKKLLAEKPSE
ncbi:hypothetical protein C9374_009022 [Naegleria lovaniensis]|uniref:Glutathione peroxidase n=1 Tax=Naegleria lovaniensis TaxID=51637 RepID=A0AA88KF09_NAELO|nr:uncharacterized protein C9374_009022 [Naegleria lovaniensis]KAG2377937.1 hypothetical protein C9374_009022 [Naegleria lovaniensis]